MQGMANKVIEYTRKAQKSYYWYTYQGGYKTADPADNAVRTCIRKVKEYVERMEREFEEEVKRLAD